MLLSDLSVKRPVTAAVASALLLVAGIVAFLSLPVRQYPDIDPPVVTVETNYTGAAAAVVETRITQLLEERVAGISGIRTIESESRDGRSDISIEFQPGSDIDTAANDVRDRISGALDNLPDEADPPEVQKVEGGADVAIWLNLNAKGKSLTEMSDFADKFLEDRFASIEGVAAVRQSGGGRQSMRIWLDRSAMAARQMTPDDIESALREQNVELPAGRVESTSRNLSLRVERSFRTPEEFRQLVLRRGEDGYLVRLGDVARVELGPENPYAMFRGNGVPQIGLGIVPQSGANQLAMGNKVLEELKDVQRTLPPEYTLVVNFDRTRFIDAAINAVFETLAIAAVLVIAVIYLFLGSMRATLIPAVTVPICLIASFAVLALFGYSINLLTLLALVIAIGLVVDDAIVVMENIYYRAERGESGLVASYKGTRQVGFAVIATTAVVCAVFVPLMFTPGNTGLLFRELAVAVIAAVLLSSFVALTLTPALCSKIVKPDMKRRVLAQKVDRILGRVTAAYGRSLDGMIDRIWLIGGVCLLLVCSALLIGSSLKSELAPREDFGVAFVNARAPEGTSFQEMERSMLVVEQRLLPFVEDGTLRRILVRAPTAWGSAAAFNTGWVMATLHPWGDRDFTTEEVVGDLRRAISDIPSIRVGINSPGGLGGRGGKAINFVISGGTYEELAQARDALLAEAGTIPAIASLDADYQETTPQLLINIDTTRAGDLGVPVSRIGRTLETMMGSRRVTTYNVDGEEYQVILQAREEDRLTPSDLYGIYVRSDNNGQLIPLSNMISLRESADASSLSRFNRLRSITLSGDVAEGYTLGTALEELERAAFALPQVSSVDFKGESREFKEASSALLVVLGLTLLVVYLVLAAQFESFVHPGIIMLTVPLAIAGGLVGLVVMGGSFNLFSQVGIVMLIGLATKNGILIVEFANQLRDEGLSVREAILESSRRRLRPILMTSVATVVGAVPLMLATGAGSAARAEVGTVLVWGVSLATLLTLYLIPATYNRLARFSGSPMAVTNRLEAELRAEGQPAE